MPSPPPEGAATRGGAFGTVAVLLFAAGILSIGLTRDWRLLHEDNGAFHTSMALSHLRLGLGGTRAHNLLVDARTGERQAYGHHPPGPPLILSAAFRLTGSDSPAVARGAAILFHLGSLALLLRVLRRLSGGWLPLVVTALVAVLPMSAYFGRMANYEAFCLPFVLLQLHGYLSVRAGSRGSGLAAIAAGILLGGLVDWPAFFFGVAVTAALLWDGLREGRVPRLAFAVPAAAGLLGFGLDLAHLAWAGGGFLGSLRGVLSGGGDFGPLSPLDIALGVLETCRRYLTHTGLLACVVAAVALLVPGSPPARWLLDRRDPATERRLLAVSGGAWLAYALAAPGWAKVHPYWQFYLLPFTALSLLLVLRAVARWAESGERRALARGLLAVVLLETLTTSGYVLWLRHTRESAYAIEKTRELRSTYLAPSQP